MSVLLALFDLRRLFECLQAARRREKRTVAPYRSYEVEESLEMVPSLPTTPEASEPRNQITPGKEETPRKREVKCTRILPILQCCMLNDLPAIQHQIRSSS